MVSYCDTFGTRKEKCYRNKLFAAGIGRAKHRKWSFVRHARSNTPPVLVSPCELTLRRLKRPHLLLIAMVAIPASQIRHNPQ